MSIRPQLVEGFAFQGESQTWNAIMAVLGEAIEDELATAISRETLGEERIHAAGRAEALRDLKSQLEQLRHVALTERGIQTTMIDTKDG